MLTKRYSQFTEATPSFEMAPSDWTDAWGEQPGQILGYCPIIVPATLGERFHVKTTIAFALDVNTQSDTVQARLVVSDALNPGPVQPITGLLAAKFVMDDGSLATLDLAGEFSVPFALPSGRMKIGVQLRDAGTLIVSWPSDTVHGWIDYTVIKL